MHDLIVLNLLIRYIFAAFLTKHVIRITDRHVSRFGQSDHASFPEVCCAGRVNLYKRDNHVTEDKPNR